MFKHNRCYDKTMNYTNETTFSYNMNNGMNEYPSVMPMQEGMMGNITGGMPETGCTMPPVYECPQERVINRDIVHEVPHICPINTRIVNHHIYKHTYTPCYTCCEENVCCNVYEGNCCQY